MRPGGWRRDCTEGPSVTLRSGRTLPGVAQTQVQADSRCDGDEGSAERIAWGDWGEAAMVELAYKNPHTGKGTQIRQAVRIARRQPFELKVGTQASVVC